MVLKNTVMPQRDIDLIHHIHARVENIGNIGIKLVHINHHKRYFLYYYSTCGCVDSYITGTIYEVLLYSRSRESQLMKWKVVYELCKLIENTCSWIEHL